MSTTKQVPDVNQEKKSSAVFEMHVESMHLKEMWK